MSKKYKAGIYLRLSKEDGIKNIQIYAEGKIKIEYR